MLDPTMDSHSNTTPKHVFLHLLLIAMLYATVIAAITLFFNYTDYIFFDSAFDYKPGILNALRWSSSVLIVSVPVLIAISWLVGKELHNNEAVRMLRTRRWLLYFTQFITAITIIIDLMVLIYNFYGGDLTARFITKVLIVLVIAAMVLGYYYWELRRTSAQSVVPKVAGVVLAVALFSSIVAGYFVVGSPAEQRGVRLDEQRLTDLANVQSQVLAYAELNNALPSTDELVEYLGVYPNDPVTNEAYIYEVVSAADGKFKLCGTFDTEAQTDEPLNWGYDLSYPVKSGAALAKPVSWKHPKGAHCFNRTVEFADTTTNTNTNSTTAKQTISLYYADPEATSGGETFGCGDTLTTVEVEIDKTDEPVKPALEQLFAKLDGPGAPYQVFYNSNLAVDEVTYSKSIAVVHLSGELVLGGTCDSPRVEEVLTKTITQFAGVTEAQIFVNDVPLDEVLSQQ